MNVSEGQYKQYNYDKTIGIDENFLRLLFGHCEVLNSYDTYQYSDYSKYDCDVFDEKHKREVRDTQFPKDLEKAFELGKRLLQITL